MADAQYSFPGSGMQIFQDVFRRADKNDIGAVSWDDFVPFFADGVMGKEELQSLFNEIDTHNTSNIDCGELCEYFSKQLGPFKEIYTQVEQLNKTINDALLKTSQEYPGMPRKDQFAVRFLLREMLNQFSSLQRPLEAASDTLDEQAKQERGDIRPIEVDATPKLSTSGIIPGRVVRRAKRQYSSQSSTSEGGSVNLAAQVERLSSLLDRLENKVNFDGIPDEMVDLEVDDVVVLVKRTLSVKEESVEEFRTTLTPYLENTQKAEGCLHITVRSYRDSGRFVIYELWNSEKQYKRYGECDMMKAFEDGYSSLLGSLPDIGTMNIPANWWKKNY